MVFRRVPGLASLSPWRGDFERMANDFFQSLGAWPQAGSHTVLGNRAFPAVNVWETEHELHAEAELPGVEPGNVEVSVEGNELSIKGQRTIREAEGATYHRRERGAGTFSRVLRLPVEVNAEAVKATLKDGVLSIVLPKAEAARPRKIPVTVAN